ncbi:MAG: hypothetical protein ACI4XA_09895 [Oscillospiraceae bacterium]
MSDYITLIFQNASNSAGTAAETSAGFNIGSILLLVLIGFLVCVVACAVGMAVAAVFRLFDIDIGSMAACTVGTIILMVVSPEKSTFECVLGVGMVIVGIACTALAFMSVKAYGRKKFNKGLFQGCAYYYGAFALSIFAISSKWYGMLPWDINKWCIYIPLILSGLGALNECFDAIIKFGKEES